MNPRACRLAGGLCLLLCLGGCKVDLYSGLVEDEANQMLALLMLRGIEADKDVTGGGDITIRVDKAQFVNAVEVLRQHGLPGKKTDSMEDLFPSGQLVTSPAQEQAKILYLKEQLLEKMLRGMEGVVSAQVSIAESASQHRREPPTLSASVFIKHSPEVNLANREADIRHLVFNGIPNLQPEKISLLLQATAYRYQPRSPPPPGAAGWLASRRPVLIALLAGLAVALGALALWFRRHPAWR